MLTNLTSNLVSLIKTKKNIFTVEKTTPFLLVTNVNAHYPLVFTFGFLILWLISNAVDRLCVYSVMPACCLPRVCRSKNRCWEFHICSSKCGFITFTKSLCWFVGLLVVCLFVGKLKQKKNLSGFPRNLAADPLFFFMYYIGGGISNIFTIFQGID